jgi:hypothetical protein
MAGTTGGKDKDHWDKIGILLQPLGGLLTATAVAYVGLMGSRVLEERQSSDSNSRLYSELMSRREEAESTLRKDVLGAILQEYLQAGPADLDAKVLQLELLSNNFHESLDLRPLFTTCSASCSSCRPRQTAMSCSRASKASRARSRRSSSLRCRVAAPVSAVSSTSRQSMRRVPAACR